MGQHFGAGLCLTADGEARRRGGGWIKWQLGPLVLVDGHLRHPWQIPQLSHPREGLRSSHNMQRQSCPKLVPKTEQLISHPVVLSKFSQNKGHRSGKTSCLFTLADPAGSLGVSSLTSTDQKGVRYLEGPAPYPFLLQDTVLCFCVSVHLSIFKIKHLFGTSCPDERCSGKLWSWAF